ncbi:MAG TPA: nuclear transport factor 2 family protein [Candidatus Udaeobacter sp.]|nr:nuclear transport factor 2 family protein [Candidatus Udaeobacter sp.]
MTTTSCIEKDRSLSRAVSPVDVLKSVLIALTQRNISEAVDQFADEFTFNDHALDLEFRDKGRLTEFFQKACGLFPHTQVELVSTFECGDHAIAEWKLTATQTESFGSLSYRSPILLRGSTIVQIENGRVAEWSDYYDQLRSRRGALRAFFEEWIEY